MLNPNLYNNDDKAREGAAIQIQGQLTFTSPDQKITKGDILSAVKHLPPNAVIDEVMIHVYPCDGVPGGVPYAELTINYKSDSTDETPVINGQQYRDIPGTFNLCEHHMTRTIANGTVTD